MKKRFDENGNAVIGSGAYAGYSTPSGLPSLMKFGGEDTGELPTIEEAQRISEQIAYKKGTGVGKCKNMRQCAEQVEGMLSAIELGMNFSRAAELVGLLPATARNWLNRGEDELLEGKETDYTEFALRYHSAMGKFQALNLEIIKEAGTARGQWQASAWLLERRCPDEFALKRDNSSDIEKIVVVSDVPKELPSGTGELPSVGDAPALEPSDSSDSSEASSSDTQGE